MAVLALLIVRERCRRALRWLMFGRVRRVCEREVVACARPHGHLRIHAMYTVRAREPHGTAARLTEGAWGRAILPAAIPGLCMYYSCTLSASIVAHMCVECNAESSGILIAPFLQDSSVSAVWRLQGLHHHFQRQRALLRSWRMCATAPRHRLNPDDGAFSYLMVSQSWAALSRSQTCVRCRRSMGRAAFPC